MASALSRLERPGAGPSTAEDHEGGSVRDGTYVAGIDGLRALAVLVVLVYHQSPAEMRGGYLGVSTFFVLSGYVIGSLCLSEVARTGRLRARRFWERRVRRLMPAALTTLLVVVFLGRVFGITSGASQRGDLLAALLWCANWRFIAQGSGYQAAFANPSPVQHFWSLAIEEQFYLLFPLLVIAIARLARGRLSIVRLVVATLTVVSFGLAWWTAKEVGFDWAYYATYTRAGEILVGVLLATLLAGGSTRVLRFRGTPVVAQVGAAVGVVGLLLLAWKVAIDAQHLFSGVIWLNDLFAVAVIVGCLVGGPVTSLLGLWPLRMLGRISYGVYLYHWPLFLLLDEDRTGLHGAPLFAVRFAATLACAIVSYHFIEAPIRFRRMVPSRQVATTAMAAVAVTALVIVAVPPHLSEAQRQTAAMALLSGSGLQEKSAGWLYKPKRNIVRPVGRARPKARVLLVGDSVALTMLPGLEAWNHAHHGAQLTVDAYIQMGCPLFGGKQPIDLAGKVSDKIWPSCQQLVPSLAAAAPVGDYDAVLVVIGLGDLGSRELGDRWRHLGQPEFDRRLLARMSALADALKGDPVLWATYPRVEVAEVPGETGTGPFAENDPARVTALNQLVRFNAATHPNVTVLDLHGWCELLPKGCLDKDLRPDGVHFSWLGSKQADAWTVPQLLRRAEAARPGG